jgi:PIN domain nuclease of toxin-antitoxin system
MSSKALSAISNGSTRCYMSVITAWEIALKYQTGKLPAPPRRFMADAIREMRLVVLPVELHHAIQVHELPPIHRDPFDRLLVAQALAEGMHLVTGDAVLAKYPVRVL